MEGVTPGHVHREVKVALCLGLVKLIGFFERLRSKIDYEFGTAASADSGVVGVLGSGLITNIIATAATVDETGMGSGSLSASADRMYPPVYHFPLLSWI